MSIWFGEFELDRERRQLLRSGEPIPLEPKAYELLSLLLERRPRALSRAQIRDAIWVGTYVSDSTLGVVVNGIRQALGDDARQPRFIRTVHGFGFAFCGEAGESPAERPKGGEAPRAADVFAPESAPPEVMSADGTAPGWRAAAHAEGWRMAIITAGVIVLVVAGWLAVRRKTSSDVPASVVEPQVVPLTSFRGAELDPALSPDGTRVAFIWHGPNRDNLDVYVKEIASGEMVRVTQDPAPDIWPGWNPDGKYLAFLRWHRTGPVVFVVSSRGGHEQRLAEIAAPQPLSQQMWVSSLDWSPDGRFLAVADRATGSTRGIALVSVETGSKHMLTADAEATTTVAFPAFSPDGRRLAFLRGRPDVPTGWELLIQPLSTTTPPRARGDAAVIKGVTWGDIAWLPSGEELVVGEQRVSLDGKPLRPFRLPGRMSTADAALTNVQRVSARGAKLAFDTAELRPQLLRVPLAGAPASFVPFFPSTRGELDPAFAPDGKRVAFSSLRSGEGHIWIGNADGSACRELPHPSGAGYAGSPRWSPDGRRLAFDVEFAGTYHVYVTAPEGGTLRRLTSEPTSGARPRWSRDGRFIYFASTRSGDWQLWKMPASAEGTDADAIQVTRSGGMEAEESPDGRYLYYAKRDVPGVFRMSLEAQSPDEEKVLDVGGEGLWQLTSRGILVLDLRPENRPTIRSHDLATRTMSVVLELTVPPEWDFASTGGAFTVSPDERWALIGTVQAVESDIMLLDGFR